MTDTAVRTLEMPVDHSENFIQAMSICGELESMCLRESERQLLALLGLTGCELMEYGARVPARLDPVALESIPRGLTQLEVALTQLLRDASDLCAALWIHQARELVRDCVRMST